MSNYYYTSSAGDVVGPVSRHELEKLVDSRQVGPATQICREGSEDWQSLSAFLWDASPAEAHSGDKKSPDLDSPGTLPDPTAPSAVARQTNVDKEPARASSVGSQNMNPGRFAPGIIISLIIIILLLGWEAYSFTRVERLLDKQETTPTFEYRIEAPYDSLFDKEMNRLGKQGWEIVSARRATSESGYSAKYEVILKRQVR